ncbi:MAG: DUF2304 domain-containing protein [Chloroflexi bacterium]|nr:MAG: DUF2304 domain-containing protein [Chloroflexota bacterium]
MSGIQLLAIAFAVAMAFWTYRTYRRRDLLPVEAVLWFAIWIGLVFVSAFPDVMRSVVGPLHVARLLDLVMIVALLLLSTLVFVLNSRVRHTERRIVELVRKLALSAEEPDGNGKHPVGQVHGDAGETAE